MRGWGFRARWAPLLQGARPSCLTLSLCLLPYCKKGRPSSFPGRPKASRSAPDSEQHGLLLTISHTRSFSGGGRRLQPLLLRGQEATHFPGQPAPETALPHSSRPHHKATVQGFNAQL